jgi:hypothetical protein
MYVWRGAQEKRVRPTSTWIVRDVQRPRIPLMRLYYSRSTPVNARGGRDCLPLGRVETPNDMVRALWDGWRWSRFFPGW